MTTATLTDRESAARRRILFQFASRNPSCTEFKDFVSDMKLFMPVPDDLVFEVAHQFHLPASSNNTAASDDGEYERSEKRQRIEEQGGALPDLFALYSGDTQRSIISYSSVTEFCKLELLNKQFRSLINEIWKVIAKSRFGMTNGKDGWRMGTSFLRKPEFILMGGPSSTYGHVYYGGSPRVTVNDSLVAIVTEEEGGEDCAPAGIGLYDAKDLDYLGPQQPWTRKEGGALKTTIAGPPGNHLFISSMPDEYLLLTRGDKSIEMRSPRWAESCGDGIPLIASETHLVIVIGDVAKLYRIVPSNNVLAFCHSVTLYSFEQNEYYGNNRDIYFTSAIEWGQDKSELVVYHSARSIECSAYSESKITVWSLDTKADKMTCTKRIETGKDLRQIVLGQNFVAGSCNYKKICVWDRHTGQKIHDSLCDVSEGEELAVDSEELRLPVRMSCHGHMLISSSHIGPAICVWNMKTGQILERYNHEGITDIFFRDNVVSSMAYLDSLNGYMICANGFLCLWAFPTNKDQQDTVRLIHEREGGDDD